MNFFVKHKLALLLIVGAVCASLFLFVLPKLFASHYYFQDENLALIPPREVVPPDPVFVPAFVMTPEPLKGLYMTSWTAGTPILRGGLVKIVDDTELNTVVIDIKDYSGRIAFPIENPDLKKYGSEEVRIRDLREFIDSLHEKHIYVIARIAVFQDAYFVKHRPDLAVKNRAGTVVWKDRKGISWIDPGSQEYWDYIVLLSSEARKLGFDEINFDYIRFPSDGNMQDISYPFSSSTPKTEVMREFFSYLRDHISNQSEELDKYFGTTTPKMKISADLFGMVTTAGDDMGIGQYLETALPYFDYVMPMVYPSHYPPTFQGFQNPEAHPYEVVKYAMQSGIRRAENASTSVAKLRPWLQDFGLKMNYGSAEVKAQIKAVNDVGLTSWVLWSASNRYTKGALGTE